MMTKYSKYYTLTAIALSALVLLISEAYAETESAGAPPQVEEQKPDLGAQGGSRSEKFEKRGKEMFEKTDTNKDGFLSIEEMEASHRERMEEMFNKTDLDKDGKLSPEELQKGRESMRDRFQKKYQGGKNRPEPSDKPAE